MGFAAEFVSGPGGVVSGWAHCSCAQHDPACQAPRVRGMQVVDFQWHAGDPYTMVSVSESGEGGTLQVWRISDMIWRPIDEVLAELEQHRWELLWPVVTLLEHLHTAVVPCIMCLILEGR